MMIELHHLAPGGSIILFRGVVLSWLTIDVPVRLVDHRKREDANGRASGEEKVGNTRTARPGTEQFGRGSGGFL